VILNPESSDNFEHCLQKKAKGYYDMRFRFLGMDYTDKLDDDFTINEVNKFILSMQNNKATGYDGIPAEAWMMIVTKHERTEVLTKLFSMIRNI
jgi:hypothetical protein